MGEGEGNFPEKKRRRGPGLDPFLDRRRKSSRRQFLEVMHGRSCQYRGHEEKKAETAGKSLKEKSWPGSFLSEKLSHPGHQLVILWGEKLVKNHARKPGERGKKGRGGKIERRLKKKREPGLLRRIEGGHSVDRDLWEWSSSGRYREKVTDGPAAAVLLYRFKDPSYSIPFNKDERVCAGTFRKTGAKQECGPSGVLLITSNGEIQKKQAASKGKHCCERGRGGGQGGREKREPVLRKSRPLARSRGRGNFSQGE